MPLSSESTAVSSFVFERKLRRLKSSLLSPICPFVFKNNVVTPSLYTILGVSVTKFFTEYGMDAEYDFEVTAKMTVNDPDEFIRNADMVVDLIVDIDNATGGNLQNAINKATTKMEDLATKLFDWIEIK